MRPLRSGDILAARFFAPKIININDPPATRQLGWRKLIRLRVQPGSMAAAHQIDAAIILLNFFTNPGEAPFEPAKESGNTQVILTSTAPGKDSIYWLDPKSNTNLDIWALPMFGDQKPFPVVATNFADVTPSFSPDGKWLAYANSETGRMEVYIQPFPSGAGRWQV